ncbi:MAG: hypothetical protein A2Y00_04410 [Omnitrophica WOR_2 bacterium GWF2_43_52]|nr:MAG: hypothetical protein A2Y06_06935 [Omnitrophica WOR_2 bacterium GWA2_37_7]OGX15095.1 MAG: hypothetical protein A2Y01_08165 [Omnitrophica WOR_2 bacterium GWC2_44_8]OGX21736.1 MAG: hypothetical protein A2Y00_04410 [Omnitrophica WOR_2 bacterium GWF2_43_52]OGX54792.1 MAG: hypothetical protein A2460_01800 [Omnitrophica WOR_2 bacterium RIFOXYC2_FULL_43_9]HAH21883.1 hypothetical protein [Candidatus Omnitrophota bacterium]
MNKKRSIGVTIIAAVLILYLLWSLEGGVRSILLGSLDKPDTVFNLSSDLWYFRVTVELILEVFLLIGAVGLLFLKSWARKLIVYLTISFALWQIIWGIYLAPLFGSWAEKVQADSGLPAIYFAIGIFIFGVMPIVYLFIFTPVFLTRPNVKEQFK